MGYLVFEFFGGAAYAGIIKELDGNNKVFTSKEEAFEKADSLDDGKVLDLETLTFLELD